MNPDDPRHGTVRGYVAHRRDGEDACLPCMRGSSEYVAERRKRRYLARGGLRVPALGTKRRIRALMALGWPSSELDARLGRKRSYTNSLIRESDQVLLSTATEVRALYDELSMQRPVGWQHDRTRKIAARRGWAPPLAYDEGRIDDPSYTPRGWQYSPATRLETFTELVERGAGVSELCRHLGLTRAALQKWCANNGLSAEFRASCGREHNYSTSANGGAA